MVQNGGIGIQMRQAISNYKEKCAKWLTGDFFPARTPR